MTDEVRNLLGGYATGTLTEEEKNALFEAALHDDKLFAALADEEALKELLDDGAVRAQLLRATEEPRFTIMGALREWFERPKSKAVVATGAVLLAVIGFQQMQQLGQPTDKEKTISNMAEMRRPDTELNQLPSSAAPESGGSAPERRVLAPQGNFVIYQPRREAAEQTTKSAATPPSAAQPQASTPSAAPAEAEQAKKAGDAAAGAVGTIAATSEASAGGAAPAMTATNSFRSSQPSAAAAPPPPPAPASARKPISGMGAFQRAAGTSITPLRFELLRRTEGGDFQPVPADHVFVPGDVIRLRVSSTRDGVVGVSSNTNDQVASGLVVANTWTEVPPSGGYALTAATEKLVVRLAPSDPLSSTRLLDSVEARAKQAQLPSVYLEIPIRQKTP